MPYQTVAIHLQPQLTGVVDELVGYTEVEDAFSRCQHLWFHTVFCYHAVEVLGQYGISCRHLPVALPLQHR